VLGSIVAHRVTLMAWPKSQNSLVAQSVGATWRASAPKPVATPDARVAVRPRPAAQTERSGEVRWQSTGGDGWMRAGKV
jgi:hypothetical protein